MSEQRKGYVNSGVLLLLFSDYILFSDGNLMLNQMDRLDL